MKRENITPKVARFSVILQSIIFTFQMWLFQIVIWNLTAGMPRTFRIPTSSLHLRTFYYFQLHSWTFPRETCSRVMEMLVTAEDRQQPVTLKPTARPTGRNPSKVRNIGTQGGKSPVWIFPGSCTPHPPPFSREHAGTLLGVETFMIVALCFNQ